MYSPQFDTPQWNAADTSVRSRVQAPIELSVRDIATSRKFYSDLLGFVPAAEYGYSDNRVVLVSPLLANGYRSIVLSRGRAGNSHGLLLELETAAELLDRYLLARLLGASTGPLLSRGRNLLVTVQDPDGHMIELRSANRCGDVETPGGTPLEHRPRWGRYVEAGRGGRFGRAEADRTTEAPPAEESLTWFDSLCVFEKAS
jgi:hypothetical protein